MAGFIPTDIYLINGNSPGQDPPSKVYGSVAIGVIGWGFVNHSSHVDFQRNVVHDFTGAAFMTEAGDELGNFFDNIAVQGTGVPGNFFNNRLTFGPQNRTGAAIRPQPLGDLGLDENQYVGFRSAIIPTVYAGYPGIEDLSWRT